ncbi:winged helix-turn-helix domain-containing protein [Enterococcus ureilyticus]|uniref:winged helix-turn-helix domain-containing protein n=1 Tax=Enterococcus ureilyticus TaxID=1131292 RepID=UPI001A924B48|nr:helix-turn-helix domain-containing protein [Enterococcus ureilyticus]MBO0445679.1 winged helix-turn-helix domain-containing protein [Enterococcus ureilyticus]
MYTIGIFRDSSQPVLDYTKEFVSLGHEVTILQIGDVGSELVDVDAFIIEESALTELSCICKNILELRMKLNKLIWVLLIDNNEEVKTKKKIYLQLGADGVSVYEEEFVLQFSNILKRIENKDDLKILQNISTTKALLELLPENLSVLREGKVEINLTKLEFKVLELLFNKHDKALSYEEIYQQIWANENTEKKEYRVSNIIFHLRAKIEEDPTSPKFIKTVRTIGYKLALNQQVHDVGMNKA